MQILRKMVYRGGGVGRSSRLWAGSVRRGIGGLAGREVSFENRKCQRGGNQKTASAMQGVSPMS